MDYSQLSDQEINLLVAKIQHPDKTFIESKTRSPSVVMLNHINMWIDYCNNPADAWPIISKHRISIEFDGDNSTEPQTTWCHTTNLGRTIGTQYQKNPLRAAMINFLMMQEGQHA
ncbi:phage protein NinX family protein [Cronobacter dublinensis]